MLFRVKLWIAVFRIAFDKYNAAGGLDGYEIEYIVYDYQNDVQQAINAYTRLVDEDGAILVLGPPNSNIGHSLVDLAAQKKVPVLGQFIDNTITMNADGSAVPYMYLAQPTNQQIGKISAAYLIEKLKKTKIALFYDETNAFGISQVESFKEYALAHGATIVSEQKVLVDTNDFKTHLQKIKEAGAEAIFNPEGPPIANLYLTQLSQLGLMDEIVTLGGLEFAPPFINLVNDPETLGNNVVFALNIALDDPEILDVSNTYLSLYKDDAKTINEISVKAYLGYDMCLLMEAALKNAAASGKELTGETVNAGT